jgi:hypothetical protein
MEDSTEGAFGNQPKEECELKEEEGLSTRITTLIGFKRVGV